MAMGVLRILMPRLFAFCQIELVFGVRDFQSDVPADR
jgi:hypothetical protein